MLSRALLEAWVGRAKGALGFEFGEEGAGRADPPRARAGQTQSLAASSTPEAEARHAAQIRARGAHFRTRIRGAPQPPRPAQADPPSTVDPGINRIWAPDFDQSPARRSDDYA